MDSKRSNRQVRKARPDGRKKSDKSDQRDLWSASEDSPPEAAGLPSEPASTRDAAANHRDRRTIQDLLFREGLLAARLAQGLDSLEELQERLTQQLPQNSRETRTRYAQSVLKWFFPEGFSSLAPRVASAYHDEAFTGDVLRSQYLLAEPIVGACVAECLYPLDLGMRVPVQYLDRFLRGHLGEEPPARTRDRLKTNLMRLGFLGRTRGHPDQLLPVNPTPTATLVLVHSLFAPEGPRTVELRNLLAHPFWKYLGYKSEDAVRGVLRAADVAGLVGKYVVADQLEQVTTCLSLDELLARRAAPVKTASELASLFRQKTWDKDLVLWVGAESRLRELLGTVPTADLDLLDLFDPDHLPMDDDETRTTLQRNLRQALQSHAIGPGTRRVLLVRSVSLLARYHVGVRDFYEWFCNDFAMVVLTLGRLMADPIATDEVVCVPDRLLQYFRIPDVVKQVYGEGE